MLTVAVGVAVMATVGGLLLGTDADPAPPEGVQQAKSDSAKPNQPRDRGLGDRRKPPQPDIPRLIGMTPEEVRQALEPTGLPVNLEADCGPPDDARVVIQQPEPRGRLHFNEVRVWLDRTAKCGGHAEKECAASELKLDAIGHQSYSPPHTGKTVGFTVKTTSGSPCQLRAHASITITGAEVLGQPIRGNPHWFEFDTKLTPNDGEFGYSEWADTCPSHKGPVTVAVDLAGLHAETVVHPPYCRDPKGVSKLY